MNVEILNQQKISGNKNLSTEQSRNSLHLVPRNTAKAQQYGDVSLRLFTFMNLNEENKQKEVEGLKRKQSKKQCKKKSVKKLGSPTVLKGENSGIIQIIEESRKKRQHFLKLIIDEECVPVPENTRRCRTPTGIKTKTVITPKANDKKPLTQRMSLGYAFPDRSPSNKLFRARSSLGSIAQTKNAFKQNSFQKKTTNQLKKKQTDQKDLLKKKQQLEKQLLQINQSLFLKKRKATNMIAKTKNSIKYG